MAKKRKQNIRRTRKGKEEHRVKSLILKNNSRLKI
jgi:hypothetical protein